MNKKVMIVEDEQAFHDLYRIMFEGKGYDITYAYDGDEAMRVLEQNKPDLIILDMLLDMVTGDTFFLHLKGMPEYADIPVIIISAFSQKQYKNLEEIDPNLVYIEKSYLTKEMLLKEVDKILIS
ncbi:MAG: two-component response regulator [Candidatus Scalindua rubra]|uniref:Two-component response regulator n=1 Tax=Candidatus Scalindua rubra TaxID=1872076 RepID=A0A1E3XGN6_9BACT|nr:MAG: two-component response regulator [Candidatus Scalindua rubra]